MGMPLLKKKSVSHTCISDHYSIIEDLKNVYKYSNRNLQQNFSQSVSCFLCLVREVTDNLINAKSAATEGSILYCILAGQCY